ncbi:MAG: DoxX family protein [Candidatus Marinimicrobia bacterium]|nr:DoxX family protein [Candidatus Neomarinimicrobiota bacterium]
MAECWFTRGKIVGKIYPYLELFCRIIIGGVFLWASVDKIIDPSKFSREISNYHIIPFGLENLIAIALPWLELMIGIGLILGFYINANTIIAGFLLVIFNVLVFQAMMRGFNIECGCGLKEGQMVGYGKLFENFILLLGCLFILKVKDRILYFKKNQ